MVAHNGKARLVGVIGNPIAHSLSPAIHEYWLQKYGINGAYVPLNVKEGRFEQTVEILLESGFVGFNVTLPYKEKAYQIATSHDTSSKICKAANTLVLQNSSNLHAMNTDVFGFTQMIERANGLKPIGEVLLLGAGGSARAVTLALQMLGVKRVIIANRTLERAELLARELQVHGQNTELLACDLANASDYLGNVSIVVSTISIGSNATDTIFEIIKNTNKNTIIADISYGKGGTEITRFAQKCGRANMDGLIMLLWQATYGFEQWFGVTPQVDDGLINHISALVRQ